MKSFNKYKLTADAFLIVNKMTKENKSIEDVKKIKDVYIISDAHSFHVRYVYDLSLGKKTKYKIEEYCSYNGSSVMIVESGRIVFDYEETKVFNSEEIGRRVPILENEATKYVKYSKED